VRSKFSCVRSSHGLRAHARTCAKPRGNIVPVVFVSYLVTKQGLLNFPTKIHQISCCYRLVESVVYLPLDGFLA